ncbi:uncharacterized protein LOC143635600 [Bidens hawaiensis]|uniref:uncharacterized protein LOC143635600 n=1 Tax=Bidens hawaiensis TaxID=980011 RepID=UPI00404A883A
MAKSIKGRRRIASRHHRTHPYPMLTRGPNGANENKPTTVKPIKDWEDIVCSVCMEYPHNAVLLLCSFHDKGCRPYMCGTSSRYSNCLDQYKNANMPVEKCGELTKLVCPLCRGQVKGWTVVESAREYFNTKKRSCMHDQCSFVGVYKELKKHVRSEHLSVNPREVDPDQEQRWRRLERDRERDDVISTITSSMPGSMVFGDYVIEGNAYDTEAGFDTGADNNLVNVLLLLHAFGGGSAGGIRRRDGEDDDDDGGGGGGGDVDDNNGMSLVNRLRRQAARRRRMMNQNWLFNGGQT